LPLLKFQPSYYPLIQTLVFSPFTLLCFDTKKNSLVRHNTARLFPSIIFSPVHAFSKSLLRLSHHSRLLHLSNFLSPIGPIQMWWLEKSKGVALTATLNLVPWNSVVINPYKIYVTCVMAVFCRTYILANTKTYIFVFRTMTVTNKSS